MHRNAPGFTLPLSEVRPPLTPAPRRGRRPPLIEAVGVPALARRDATYRRLLGFADIFAAVLALVLVVSVLGDDRLRPASLLCVPLIAIVSRVIGLYDRDEALIRKTTMDEAPTLFQLATLYTLLFWLAESVLVDGSLSDGQVVAMWISIFVLTLLGRVVARALAKRLSPNERILFVGDETSFRRVDAKLSDHHLRATLVARVALVDTERRSWVGHEFEVLREVTEHLEVHRLVVCSAGAESDSTLELIRAAKALGIRVSLLPRILEVVGSSTQYDDLHGLPILGVRRFGLSRSAKIVKRAFDLAGASLALIVLGPLMLMIALAIKLDSRGPVFFRQLRVGRGGRPFQMIKFRTMVRDAERMKAGLRGVNEAGEGLFKIATDPRVTRVGRILRSTSLDELPQLLNVMRSEMSLVGPRPLVLDEDRQITGWDRGRLALTPGMTGHWQILGARVPLAEMVKIDYLYVSGWTLWSDVKLLVRTVPYMLARRGM